MLRRASPLWSLVLFTAVHGVVRILGFADPASTTGSRLVPGDTVQFGLILQPTPAGTRGEQLDPSDLCQIVVAFDASCSVSWDAAGMSASNPTYADRRVTWVAPEEDSARVNKFRDRLPSSAVLVRSDAALQALAVDASPIAFALDAAGRVRHIWTFRGTELREYVESACAH